MWEVGELEKVVFKSNVVMEKLVWKLGCNFFFKNVCDKVYLRWCDYKEEEGRKG